MCILYMKSILGGPWLLGAQGSRLPLPNGYVRPCQDDGFNPFEKYFFLSGLLTEESNKSKVIVV